MEFVIFHKEKLILYQTYHRLHEWSGAIKFSFQECHLVFLRNLKNTFRIRFLELDFIYLD